MSSGAGVPASLSEQAYYAIRDLILRGTLPLGAALSRRRLAAQLGMSMLPISEAVQRLESEGLLESRPQVGTRVRVPTPTDVQDRFIIREALESQSARLFAERATPAERAELQGMAEELDAMYARRMAGESGPEFVFAVHARHFDLHMRIAQLSGCAGLQEMIRKNNVLVFNWVYDLVGQQPQQPPHFHQALAEALCTGDSEAADRTMRAHVRYGMEDTVRAIERLEPRFEGKWRLRGKAAGKSAS